MGKPQPKPAPAPAANADLVARLAALEAENKTLRAAAKAPIAMKVIAGSLTPGKEAEQFTKQFGHLPKYELTDKAYIGDILYNPEEAVHPLTKRSRPRDQETGDLAPLLIEYEGIPGPHMVPYNDAAKAMVAAHPRASAASINPVESLTIIGPNATVLQPQR